MKKILSLLFVFAAAFVVLGQGLTIRSAFYLPSIKSSSAPATCSTNNAPDVSQSGAGANTVGYTDQYYYAGMFYTNSSSVTVCGIGTEVVSITGDVSAKTLRVGIWSVSGNDLNAELAGVDVVTGAAAGWYTNTFASPVTLSASTTYAIAWTVSSTDTSNYINLGEAADGVSKHVANANWDHLKALSRGPFDFYMSLKLWYQ